MKVPCPEPEGPICLLHLGGAFVALGVLASDSWKDGDRNVGLGLFGDIDIRFLVGIWLDVCRMFVGFWGLLH